MIVFLTLFWQTNFPEYQGPEKIVIRRYSDFVWLRDRLFEKYKGIFIPPLPEKSTVGKEQPIYSFFFYLKIQTNYDVLNLEDVLLVCRYVNIHTIIL